MARVKRDYTIHYAVVPPEQFEDWAIVWRHPGYSRPPAPTPNEGEHGAKSVLRPSDYRQKQVFYDGLLTSVSKQGVTNPVFALQYEDGLFVRYGCSRVWAAKKAKVGVPVIVANYTDKKYGLPLYTEAGIRKRYTQQPALVELEQDYMRIDGCAQTTPQ